MTVDDLLAEVEERGWLLNNLFQIDDCTWQCNLRTTTHHTAYGKGHSAAIAIAIAIDNIESALESAVHPQGGISSIEPVTQSFNLAAALANLRPEPAAIFRRKL